MFHKPTCFYFTCPPWILPTDGIWTAEDTDALPIQRRHKLAILAVALVPLCCSTQPSYCTATELFILWLIYLLLTGTLYNPASKILQRQTYNNEIIYKANLKTTYTNAVAHGYVKLHTRMRRSNKATMNAEERVFRSDLYHFIFPG